MTNQENAIDQIGAIGPPTTLDGWEKALVKYFLSVGDDGDSSDLHAFEVSGRTLALACGLELIDAQVENAFHAVLASDPALELALQNGHIRKPSQEQPGFFVYLVLTLFIDGLLDEHNSISGAFRRKLASWLGKDRSFNDLHGVASMWRALEIWLEQRANAGAPFRRLVLPDPGEQHQIGHTRRLSFPTRHDYRTVQNFISSNTVGIDGPAGMLLAFRPLLNEVSVGLREAYEDFRSSYYLRRRALADHRFWRLIIRVRQIVSHAGADQHTTLEMTFNDYGEPEFRRSSHLGGEAQSYATLSSALSEIGLMASSDLAAALRRGYLFFRQVGMGRWQAELDLGRCTERVFVALTTTLQVAIGMRLGMCYGDSSWRITNEPKSIGLVQTVFVQARILIDSSDSIFRPAASNGIRVHGRWLGLPGFLPLIETDSSQITITPKANDAAVIEVADLGNNMQLIAEAPVDGTYTVQPELGRKELSIPWRILLDFTPHAVPHAALSCARQRLPQLRDWGSQTMLPGLFAPIVSQNSEIENSAMEWLLEAVYADGFSGWDETDLVSLVRRTAPEFEGAPWPMLHLLQDAGVITARLRHGWKGRVWTLAAPRIVQANYGGQEVALVEGALCSKLIEDFNIAVLGLGGLSFKRRDLRRWSVPVVGATNVSSSQLAGQLGWPLSAEIAFPGKVPLSFARTERQAEYYRTSSVWCWSAKRFVFPPAKESTVSLSRLSHKAGTDHDVFRVEFAGRRFHYLSRCAAIIHAHALSGVPLFRFNENRLERIAQDGALPDIIASTLRRRRLLSAGMEDGVYSYPSTEADAQWIHWLLPRCVAGLREDSTSNSSSIISKVRRSGGRLRPVWKDSQLSTQLDRSTRGSKW